MMDAHAKRARLGAAAKATAAALRERARRQSDGALMAAARATEAACAALKVARGSVSVGSKLGEDISSKGMRAADVVALWDASGDGVIDRNEFREKVLAMGVESSADEIDAIFRALDADGGGSLDMREVQKAIKRFLGEADTRRDSIRLLGLEVIAAFKLLRRAQAREHQAEEQLAAENAGAGHVTEAVSVTL